ncbi:S-layer homology domain-containing protein [Thermus oshimai]
MKGLKAFLNGMAVLGLALSPALAAQDPPPAPWAEEAVQILVAKGVFIGYPDGTFRWKNPLSREEAALALYRLLAAHGLDGLTPEEVQRIKEAVDRLLQDREALEQGLQDLRRELEALKTQPQENLLPRVQALEERLLQAPQAGPLEERLKGLEERLKALEEGLKGLQAAQAALEAQALQERLNELEEQARALGERLGAQEAQGQDTAAQLQALKERVEALEKEKTQLTARTEELSQALKDLPEAQKLLQDAQNRLEALENRVRGLEDRLGTLEERVKGLEEHLKALEDGARAQGNRQEEVEKRLRALEEEVKSLREALLPQRAALYLAFGFYRGDVDGRLYGRLSLGHDALYGPLGLRASYEGEVQNPTGPDSLLSADLTLRATLGPVDGYFGVGGGAYFARNPALGFGQLLIGADLRLFPFLAFFLEGHQRFLFDGQMGQRSTLAFGLQFRF